MYLSILLLMNVCSNYFWILTLTVLFRYCYNVGNVVDLSRYLSHSTSFSWWECPKFRHQKKYITRTENYPYQQLSQNLWYFDEIKRKLMKSFFHYCCKKNWIDFGIGSLYNLFCHCVAGKLKLFSEQEPPPSFLPNGAKPLRLEHEPSQNLIKNCQFVI